MALYPSNQPEEIRGISLCAGVGGLDLGLHIAEPNYRTVCYVERNSFAAATLVARMADTSLGQAPIWDDLKSFDGKPWRGKIHLISAGYPCQPFTLSGHRKGENDPRHLWPDVARIVGEVRPEHVFFENVPGHLSLGLQNVAIDLQGMGYRVAARVVSAAEIGGSHTRERLFILGHSSIQAGRQPGLYSAESRGSGIQVRSESDGIADGAENPGTVMDASMGHAEGRRLERGEVSLFSPKPGGVAEWRKTLKIRPDLKPCLHRLDHGLANRVDRSGAAGNGVVALAAAHAWRTLKAEMNNSACT